MGLDRAAARSLERVAERISTLGRYLGDPTMRALRRKGLPLAGYGTLRRPWLRDFGFRTILDIGANDGQFAAAAHAVFPDAAIYSFEPIPDCFAKLTKTMAGVPNFKAFNLGLGAASGEMQINRSDFSPSSSFRPMAGLHKSAYPHTAHSVPLTVRVETLDGVAKGLELAEPLLVKMDVQGYEDQVLAGGGDTARRAAAIITEVSYETLYDRQPLFDAIYRAITGMGFLYKGSLEQAEDSAGRALFADGIFVRRRA